MKYIVQLVVTLHTDQPDFVAATKFANEQVSSALTHNGEVDPQSLHDVEILDITKV